MAKERKPRLRIDKRDLPADYDPHFFYEYRIMQRSKEADGIEGLVYRYMPWSVIKSFALAIDPLSGFKQSLGKISPVNRSRKRGRTSVLDGRTVVTHTTWTSEYSIPNYGNQNGRFGPVVPLAGYPMTETYTTALQRQDTLFDGSKDTTKHTRAIGYTMGELDIEKVQIFSPGRSLSTLNSTYNNSGPTTGDSMPSIVFQSAARHYSVRPTAAVFPSNRYTALVAAEKNILIAEMQKAALPMYKGLNPQHRSYTLFRNIAELRDLPRSIATMRETAANLSKFEWSLLKNVPDGLRQLIFNRNTPIKDIPSQYLSYHFGWKQLVSDVWELCVKPAKISKQIDFLIRRSGQATTYRSVRKLTQSADGINGFVYDVTGAEYSPATRSRLVRNIELRMVINTTFDFPQLNVPDFRADLFARKLGVYPTFTDIYNLVPWTWLYDWFTGLGNYLDIIEEVNKDQSLINWGLLTGKSQIEMTTTYTSKAMGTVNYRVMPSAGTTTQNVENICHNSTALITLQLRKNLAALYDVKCITEPGSLTPYQQSILGALLAQRFK